MHNIFIQQDHEKKKLWMQKICHWVVTYKQNINADTILQYSLIKQHIH